MVDVVNDRRFEDLGPLLATEIIRHDLAVDALGDFEGIRDINNMLDLVVTAISDSHVEIQEVFAGDEHVVTYITLTGTHKGEFLGVAATGKPIEINGVNLYRVQDVKAAETWQLLDIWGFMRQIGAAGA